jgi:hypothetical protein
MKNPAFLLLLAVASSQFASAQPIAAQHKAGSMHGFLLVKSADGKVIGVGDLVQVAEGVQVHSRLLLRFRDGSMDDESTVFSEKDVLCLVSDHHVQKGPSFPTPLNVTINVAAAEVTWHETKSGKVEIKRQHMDLPDDLANGILPVVMENIPPKAAETNVSYLANDPKPRIVKLSVRPEGRESFTVGGLAYFANRYLIHIELSGLAAILAPFMGKQPADIHDWVVGGEVPSFARMQGALYLGGPVWTIQLASPVWSSREEGR